MTTIAADGAAVTYAPPEEVTGWGGSPGPRQFFTTFTPGSPNGCTLIYVFTGGFQDIDPLTEISDDTPNESRNWLVQLYQAGWTIVTPGLTGNVPLGGTQGVFSNYGGPEYLDFDGISWWERDMVFLIQKLIVDGQDPAKLYGSGQSASGIAMMNIAWGPDDVTWPSGSAQIQTKPQLAAMHFDSPAGFYPAYTQPEYLLGYHLEVTNGTGTPPPAPGTLDLVAYHRQIAAAPLGRFQQYLDGFPGTLKLPPIPVYLEATEPASTSPPNNEFGIDGLPAARGVIRGVGLGGSLHDYFFAYITKRMWERHFINWKRTNILATLPGFSYPNEDAIEDFVYSGITSQERNDSLFDWFERRRQGLDEPGFVPEDSSAAAPPASNGRLVQYAGTLP